MTASRSRSDDCSRRVLRGGGKSDQGRPLPFETSPVSAMAETPSVTRSVKRLAVIAPDATSILRQRSELLSAVLARRHSVMVLLPEDAMAGAAAIEARGLSVAAYPLRGALPHLLGDGKTIASIAATLADWRAHVLLGYGLKPMLLGGQAAQKAKVSRRVALVNVLPAAIVSADGSVTS